MPNGKSVVYDRIGTVDPVAFITIDDGYGGPYPGAAQLVSEAALPITAFLTYYAVNNHPLDFQNFGSSMDVESHAKNHLHLPVETREEQYRQISLSKALLTSLFGKSVNLFRPPYGEYSEVTKEEAYRAGFPLILTWTHSIKGGVITGGATTRGSIFLMHFDNELELNLNTAITAIANAGLTVAALKDYIP